MPRWAKHRFSVDKIFYESSYKLAVGHTVDMSVDQAEVHLVCTKCSIGVIVRRSYPDVFDQPQKGEALKLTSVELRNTPNCKKWQTVRDVMES